MFHFSCVQCPAHGAGEDRVRVVERDGQLIVVVADGAGGLGGGATAAELVVSMVSSSPADSQPTHDARYWVSKLLDIDAALARAGGGQAAAVAASVCRGEVVGAAVGDAVAWLISPSEILDLTVQAARKPLLGDGAAIPRPFGPVRLASSTLLLATDGLWKYAARQVIGQRVLRAATPGPCTELIDAVRLRSGGLQDDVGVVLVRESQT